jgi:hypothetical protein
MNYRKFYQEQIGKKYDSSEFDIHHINGNHDDNDLLNLVALPKRLHRQYHYYKNIRNEYVNDFDFIMNAEDMLYAEYFLEKTIYNHTKFLEILKEASKWVEERDRLLCKNATIPVYMR